MLIYKIKKTTLRVGKDKGKTKYFAAPVPQDKITTHQVESRIVEATALSRADVRAATTALAQIVREEMLAGRSVDLADLGTFKVISNGKYMNSEKEVTAETLKTPRIQFFPKEEMRAEAKNVGRSIVREDAPPAAKPPQSEGGSGSSGPGTGGHAGI